MSDSSVVKSDKRDGVTVSSLEQLAADMRTQLDQLAATMSIQSELLANLRRSMRRRQERTKLR